MTDFDNGTKKEILVVIGTRPEAIKMAPVIKALHEFSGHFSPIVCVTGQHKEMLDQALELFNIKPDYDLKIMEPKQSLSHLAGRLFSSLGSLIDSVKPDYVLAQGDTTSVLVSAMVAFFEKVPFGHVEAGLRTCDKYHPFPEEANRRITGIVSDLSFAPTTTAKEALIREGVPAKDIYVTGNTVVDTLLDIAKRDFDWTNGPLSQISQKKKIVLITAHRRESFGPPFIDLCTAIRELAIRFVREDVQFVYPVHLNPNVRQPVHEILSDLQNVHLLEPLDYLTMVHLMKASALILTDSGGIQEEAPSFGVPILVMRDVTERPEGVDAGMAKLVGTQRDKIVYEAERLLSDPVALAGMAKGVNPYGDGKAAKRIVSILMERMR